MNTVEIMKMTVLLRMCPGVPERRSTSASASSSSSPSLRRCFSETSETTAQKINPRKRHRNQRKTNPVMKRILNERDVIWQQNAWFHLVTSSTKDLIGFFSIPYTSYIKTK
ncbi:hypothetical protein NL108_018244 [Boleophthalmus pectinirostris]|nr:hypothetical protein NL108_018244 [Boleophthalmus pectinirostris]